MHFVSDPYKARLNLLKHRVSFDEAESVFGDKRAVVWPDTQHSDDEERIAMLGMSAKGRILLICYCYRGLDTIRIFSGRKANSNEKRAYLRSWR